MRAGLQQSSLYYWFKRKELILQAVFAVNRTPLEFIERIGAGSGLARAQAVPADPVRHHPVVRVAVRRARGRAARGSPARCCSPTTGAIANACTTGSSRSCARAPTKASSSPPIPTSPRSACCRSTRGSSTGSATATSTAPTERRCSASRRSPRSRPATSRRRPRLRSLLARADSLAELQARAGDLRRRRRALRRRRSRQRYRYRIETVAIGLQHRGGKRPVIHARTRALRVMHLR